MVQQLRSGVAFVLAAAGAAVGGGGGKRRHCKRKGRDCGFAKGGLNRPGMEYLVGDGLWGVGCCVSVGILVEGTFLRILRRGRESL